MKHHIRHATYISSAVDLSAMPKPDKPEYAFAGRSNVGKSSLINFLAGKRNLARTSGKPGKTQTINHFLVDHEWYIADLPGYGYAKISREKRKEWENMINEYLSKRSSLLNLFVLIDSRHPEEDADHEFMRWLGENEFAFSVVFTKQDKVKKKDWENNLRAFENKMLKWWETLPPVFYTSAVKKKGREEILQYITDTNGLFSQEHR